MTRPGFITCETCGGYRKRLDDSAPTRDNCPDCSGTGLQPDPAVVEVKARELHDSECTPECPYPLNRVWRDYARTVLLAYARQAEEKL